MNELVEATFVPGFIATYFQAKPLLAAPKIQKATTIVKTSENEAILKSIRDGGGEIQLWAYKTPSHTVSD